MSESTAAIYNRTAGNWQRNEPVLLSDFTARPFLIDWCGDVAGKDVLDLGCGEGYVARQLAQRGAGTVAGMDISEEMVRSAQQSEENEPLGIGFSVGDATDLSAFADDSFDLVVAVFLFNYLDCAQTEATMREVARVLRAGGTFIFAVPHPALAFLREKRPPFYFDRGAHGYFSGRNATFEGHIWRRDGASNPVRCVHKTLTDYFHGLHAAGFRAMPEIEELRVTDEHLAMDPAFFEDLRDQPLHLAFRMENVR